ncbi:ABC transporter substrate-binding protein [Janibacter melonis]|uniref:ABC transporter substrate-binding protein n=1 Tax=Janibacter melonis TaxID=262209 RepID=UPI002095FF21|nr:ABC transporter substrate-binding protein [Janibacter melonis]
MRYQGSANAVTWPSSPTTSATSIASSSSTSARRPAARRTSSPSRPARPTSAAPSRAPSSSSSRRAPRSPPSSTTTARTRGPTRVYVRKDSAIRRPRDLVGKKIAVNTLGAHAEAAIDTWLTTSGLSQSEIDQVQLVVLPPNDTEEAVRRGQVDAGALGGILQDHAKAQGDIRELFRDTEVVGPINGGQYVLRDDFIAQHPRPPES